MPLFSSILVVELPPLKPLSCYPPAPPPTRKQKESSAPLHYIPEAAKPSFILVLPQGDPAKLPPNVLTFCFPDLDHLLRAPYAYEHTAEEYVFMLTQKEEPRRLFGFCRRYRIGSAAVAHRLDLPANSSADDAEAASSCTYQCICILSEK